LFWTGRAETAEAAAELSESGRCGELDRSGYNPGLFYINVEKPCVSRV